MFQISSTQDLIKRPPSVRRSKLSANLLQSVVLKNINIARRSVRLQNRLLASAVFQQIVSSNAVLFSW